MKHSKLILLAAPFVFLFTSCDELYVADSPGYYRGSTVDFYYTSGRPYSRDYGPLYLRDNRYYYSRGGRYIVYDRHTHVARRDSRDYRDHRDHDSRDRDRDRHDRDRDQRKDSDHRDWDRRDSGRDRVRQDVVVRREQVVNRGDRDGRDRDDRKKKGDRDKKDRNKKDRDQEADGDRNVIPGPPVPGRRPPIPG